MNLHRLVENESSPLGRDGDPDGPAIGTEDEDVEEEEDAPLLRCTS